LSKYVFRSEFEEKGKSQISLFYWEQQGTLCHLVPWWRQLQTRWPKDASNGVNTETDRPPQRSRDGKGRRTEYGPSLLTCPSLKWEPEGKTRSES
jgi:hypothetical protein